jgi:hypothetical protein
MLALAYAVLHHCVESNDEFLHSHLINPLGLEYDVDTAESFIFVGDVTIVERG